MSPPSADDLINQGVQQLLPLVLQDLEVPSPTGTLTLSGRHTTIHAGGAYLRVRGTQDPNSGIMQA